MPDAPRFDDEFPDGQRLLDDLKRENFEGPAWQRLEHMLATYGLRVFIPWIRTRRVFAEMSKRAIRYLPPEAEHHYPQHQDVDSLAGETVARALNTIKEILRSGKWEPTGPAGLPAYFINQCLFKFPNVYRGWRSFARYGDVLLEDVQHHDVVDVCVHNDPAGAAIGNMAAREILEHLPDDVRAIVQLRLSGKTMKEIADLLGRSDKSIENTMARYRRKLREAGEGEVPR
jgi:RNA polymerase sigma factor (sigma-70 family)